MSTDNVVKLGWCHTRAFELKGLTRDQLDGRRKAGKFVEGYHYIKDPSGGFMYHWERFNEWCEHGLKKTG